MKLSVCMIVKNEEVLLGKCLESVKDADEIIVCDTGSEDHTIEIAKRYTDKVFTDYVWEDHFANARNHSLSKATGDWIFIIDADEYLEPGGIQKIRDRIENTKARVIDIPSQNVGDLSVHWLPRLFVRAPDIFYRGAIHNHLSVLPTEKLEAMITYAYSPAHYKDPDRAFRILSKEVEKNPTAIREKFYLAREYWYKHEYENAIKWYDEYLEKATFWAEVGEAYLVKARCLWMLNRGSEARDICWQAIKLNANFQEALEFMAEMSGPGNRKRWLEFASTASNVGVLFIRTNDRKRVYYCEGMKFFGENMVRHHGYQPYHKTLDIYKDTFFEGLYFDDDYKLLSEHKGRAVVFWNGSDLLRLTTSKENKDILKNRTNVTHLCHDYWQKKELERFGVEARVRPLFFGNIDNYQLSYRQSSHPHIYLNAHPGREVEYGIPWAIDIAKEMPHVTFHLYGLAGISFDNIVCHGQVSEAQMDQEIRGMQGCLFPYGMGCDSNFRISQTCLKAMFMGQYVISTTPMPYAWCGTRLNEIVSFIDAISKIEEPKIEAREFYLGIYEKAWEDIWI